MNTNNSSTRQRLNDACGTSARQPNRACGWAAPFLSAIAYRRLTARLGTVALLTCFTCAHPAAAATNDATASLQKGLFEEEANHNLEAAIQAYQTVVTQFDKDRKIAATAVFRLGECYRKQGNTNQATAQYERVLREFADQAQLIPLSRQNLTALGAETSALVASPSPARQEQERLLQLEIQLAEKKMVAVQKQAAAGVASQEDLWAAQREVLELRRQLAALQAGQQLVSLQGGQPVAASTTPSGTASEAAAAQAEAAALKTQLAYLSQLPPEQKRVAVQQDFPNPVLTSQMEQLGLAEQRLATLRKDFGPEHADVKKSEALVQTTGKQVDAQVNGVVTGLQARLDAAQARANALTQNEGKLQTRAEVDANGVPLPATATEAEEVRRIQAMIKDSPDLINARMSSSDGYGGWTPLQKAAYLGQMVVARFLLESGADVNATTLGSSQTALDLAAQKGHAAMASLLLSKKADVNPTDDKGQTPLHLAAENGFRTVAEVLLDHGANVDAKTKSDATPLHLAAYNGFKSVAELLLDRGAEANALGAVQNHPWHGTPLHMAANRGDQPLMELLLAHKADIKAPDNEGLTPLHTAAEAGRIGAATLLLNHGAEINGKGGAGNKQGWTPLYCAVDGGQKEMVAFLLKNKADPNLRIESGSAGTQPVEFTPLLLACVKISPDIVELLLDAKADPNVPNTRGLAPIFHAVNSSLGDLARRNRVLAALLEHGADANVKDLNGLTPLLRTVGEANKEAVALLLDHKADVNAKDNEGRTSLMYAAQLSGGRDMQSIAQLLLAAGADVNARSERGITALISTGYSGPGRSLTAIAMGELLLKHGAVEDLPLLDRIELRRPSAKYRATVFSKGTNDYNRFTLFELLAAHYGFISTSTGSGPSKGMFEPQSFTLQNSLAFPDLARMVIRRASAGKTERTAMDVNLDAIFKSDNCQGDISLQWGDVVELPEADHPINATWQGLPAEDLNLLQRCLTRGVALTVKGQTTNLVLLPQTSRPGPTTFGAYGRIEANVPQFSLWPVLIQSGFLRASSDLSRVRVRRRDPQTGQAYELVFDCAKAPPDFWLREGDAIDVPEKP
jgi:ankyrin repeat protein